MPFFREKMVINEEDRMNLMMFAHDSAKMAIMEKIFDDNSNLIRGARAAREKMAMDLISTGKVEIKNDGVSFAYNYQLEKKQFVKTPEGKPWSDRKNSNPIQDIIDWKRLGKTLGMDLRRAVCSSLTWSYLLTNENIKADMIASSINAAALTVTDANLRQHILAKTGVEVVEYSEYYQLKVGVGENPYPFYPDNKFTMMPVAALGNMMFGPTPEEIDLMGGTMNANTKITDMGVAVTIEVISRPTVNTETRVSQIVLPSLNSAGGNLIIATVV